nr:unnamed protein product [Callosobruchus chinensis]
MCGQYIRQSIGLICLLDKYVIRGFPASTTEQRIREELEPKGYAPQYIIRLKCDGSVLMPLIVVILPDRKIPASI